jgi:hypothetical protein
MRQPVIRQPRPVRAPSNSLPGGGKFLFGQEHAAKIVAAIDCVKMVSRRFETCIHDLEKGNRGTLPAIGVLLTVLQHLPDYKLPATGFNGVPKTMVAKDLSDSKWCRRIFLEAGQQFGIRGQDTLLRQTFRVQSYELLVIQWIN